MWFRTLKSIESVITETFPVPLGTKLLNLRFADPFLPSLSMCGLYKINFPTFLFFIHLDTVPFYNSTWSILIQWIRVIM